MSTNSSQIEQMNAEQLKNHIENLAQSYQVLINQEYTMSISENTDLQILTAHNVKMQINYNQLRDAIVRYNTEKYGDISEQTFPNLLSLKGYDDIKLYTPDYKDINPAPEPNKDTSQDISDLLEKFDDSLSTGSKSTDSNLSSRRNSVDMSIGEMNAFLESTSVGIQPKSPQNTGSTPPPQLNDNPELNKLIASIKNDLSQLKQLLDTEKSSIKLMNQVAERNEPIEDIVIQQYNANINKILDIAVKLEIQLQNSKPQELELIKQQTNNFDKLGEYTGQTFSIPDAEKLSDKTKTQMQERKQKEVDQFVEQMKREAPQLKDYANELRMLSEKLDQQIKRNNNDASKLDTTILNRVKALNNQLRKAVDRYNEKLFELKPSAQEMEYMASKFEALILLISLIIIFAIQAWSIHN